MDDLDRKIGKRIRHARWISRLSQYDLAVEIGVSCQQIQKYETGANRVSASTLYRISKCLNFDLIYFYDLSASEYDDAFDASILRSKSAIEFIKCYARLSVGKKKLLEDIANTLMHD